MLVRTIIGETMMMHMLMSTPRWWCLRCNCVLWCKVCLSCILWSWSKQTEHRCLIQCLIGTGKTPAIYTRRWWWHLARHNTQLWCIQLWWSYTQCWITSCCEYTTICYSRWILLIINKLLLLLLLQIMIMKMILMMMWLLLWEHCYTTCITNILLHNNWLWWATFLFWWATNKTSTRTWYLLLLEG